MSKKNELLKNFVLGIAVVCGIIIACMLGLDIITHHNRYVEAPDFTGMSVEQATRAAHKCGVNVEVVDSVYISGLGRGEVYSQFPLALSQVKKGRTIDLTINSTCVRNVSMPSLVGVSMRQACSEIKSRGLVVGRLIYHPDIATNVVLRQLFRGRDISKGTTVPAGSSIDLVLGINYENNPNTYIPNVVGMDYNHAVDILKENCLNVSSVEFDSSVRSSADSLTAVVRRQEPAASSSPVKMGTSINLRLGRSND